MHITTKGQVTIPQNIREKFGLLPHTTVSFKVDKNNRIYLVKTSEQSTRGTSLIKKMRGQGDVKMTTDEILALTRE